jgi:hypothetical protein
VATTSNPTPNIPLVTGWSTGEGEWGAPMNLNLRVVDALMNLVLKSITVIEPPASPVAGDRYYMPSTSTPTGIWAGQQGKIAYWTGAEWLYIPPRPLWVATVQLPTTQFVYHNGTDFVNQPGPGSLAALTDRVVLLETWQENTEERLNDFDEAFAAVNLALTGHDTRLTALEAALAATSLMEPATVSTGFTLLPEFMGKFILMNGSVVQTIIIPDSLSSSIAIGSSVIIRHRNPLGRVKVEASEGVTLELPFGGSAETAGAGATIGLFKAAANLWELSGQVKYQDTLAAGERVTIAPNSSGTAVALGNTTRRLLLLPLADVTTMSLAMPPDPYDGQTVHIVTRRAIATITHTATSPAVLVSPITSLAAGERRAFQYYAPDDLWLPY